jgi:hypothetical protein
MSEADKTPKGETKPFDAFLEHQRRAAEEAGKALESLLPPEFREHGKAAINESIAGFRVLIDALMEELKSTGSKEAEGKSEETPPTPIRRTKVKVDLN